MTEDAIKLYDTSNTKGCQDELILGDFNDQPIPSKYYNFLNDNIPGTPVDSTPTENKSVKDAVITNDEDISYEIIIDDDESLASDIEPL